MIWYQFEPDYTIQGRHYAHPLVSWSSIFAGAVVAIALGAVFNLIGIAIGAALFNPFHFERHEDAMSAEGGLYVMFAQFVAFQIAGYIAARSSRFPDHFGGALTGLLVWALAVTFAVSLAALSVSGLGGSQSVTGHVIDAAQDVRTGSDAADLSATEAAADTISTFAWWAAGSLLLGVAGAVAGGWIGAHHPKWQDRPRHDSVPAQQS